MKKILFVLSFLLATTTFLLAQPATQTDTAWKKEYRGSATRINDLVHTKLKVKFDYDKSYLYGEAWITLQPHFYTTDSLTLDAKGMDIHKVALVDGKKMKELPFQYDKTFLRIHLDKMYKGGENYTVYIDYTAKPNEADVHGSAAINDAKGLYFINPKGETKNKPTQIWTQGETEATSVWCPTIDKPNQKTTEEIYMTVPAKYVTLSNGKLMSQQKNADGTRTDYWKMDLPHAPYLFFMGVGDYAIIKDKWKNKDVDYYVEKEYAPVARKIFGLTPEMIDYFSKITGVDYPWVKYAQITGRDYVSGAMENTTATLHSDVAQQDARELVDGNIWESTIAHELFHQWFGDYVTTESWSNITLNESFANYSETLWAEYKYGKDAGAEQNYDDMQGYLRSHSGNKDLVRFYYRDKEDVFDAVSYNKGGRILNMLRHQVGDAAFFAALHEYLTANKFKSAEAQQLRLAFEKITGRDLNWFFNQWYYGSGNPDVDINYVYDDANGTVQVIIDQKQKSGNIFQMPIDIDIYNGAQKVRHHVWANDAIDTFTFHYTKRPDLVNVDGDKIMLWTKDDHKTLDNYIFQYKNAGNYVDRREAIEFAANHLDDEKAVDLLKTALNDPYHGLRQLALSKVDLNKDAIKTGFESTILTIAKNDKYAPVRASAIALLGQYKNKEFAGLFTKAVKDSSYTVSGNALTALSDIEPDAALSLAKQLSNEPSKGKLESAILVAFVKSGDESMTDKVLNSFANMPLSQGKFQFLGTLSSFLSNVKNTDKVKRGVEEIVNFRDAIPAQIQSQTSPFINGMVIKKILMSKEKDLKAEPNDTGLENLVNYIKSVLPDADKKSF
ncbi:MAG: HEAT repeat domain-containing protein [Chitinophagaceae bacterium]|nr:HEAT repeat domain-containing protein [Chitinophagaceae bacterium]MCB0740022.1 HEAT repeat domain-containing protein [Chitinophagaceae bacterium]